MKPIKKIYNVTDIKLFLELPEELLGRKIEITIRTLKDAHLDKLYRNILEKSIKAVDIAEDLPHWQKNK